MLSFFTDPYPNELLYSAFARYHFHSGNIDYKDTICELFGTPNAIPSKFAASHLSYFCNNAGKKYDAQSLIERHTILPYYLQFLPHERQVQVAEMIGGDAKGLFAALGITAGGILRRKGLMYCPMCATIDDERYGEPYFHREHQLQGVIVCPHDGCLLLEYPVEDSRIAFIRMRIDAMPKNDCTPYKGLFLKDLFAVSKAAYELVNLGTDLFTISCDDVLMRYKELLRKQGLLSPNGNVRQQELYETFLSRFQRDFLNYIGCGIEKDNEYCWLRTITRNSARSVHPLRHILLMLFLAGNVTSFFKESGVPSAVFDKIPYPCLNPACKNYRKNVIRKVTVTVESKTYLPVGTFACKCGFIYSRRGPDSTEADRYRIGRVKQFGQVWQNRLQGLLSQGLSRRQISIKLNCDSMTIKKYSNKLLKKDEKCRTDISTESYRQQLLDFMSSKPNMNRTGIRKVMQKEYYYLYRHDRDWLMKNLPAKLESAGSKGYIDWNARDEIILARIQISKRQLINSSELFRASRTKLAKMSGFEATLEHHREKLPMSTAFLSENAETLEKYRIRRCNWWINRNMPLKPWQLMRDAGLNKKDFEPIAYKLTRL